MARNSIRIIKEKPSIHDAARLAGLGFGKNVDEELLQNSKRYSEGDLVFVAVNENETVAWASFELYREDKLMYLKGMMIDPRFQGKGIAGRFIEEARRFTQPSMFALRTQSPHMWSVGRKMCSVWLPSPNTHIDKGLSEAAKALSSYGQFPIARTIYGGRAYTALPLHPDPTIQKWWCDICDSDTGDAVICIGYLN